MRTHRLAAAVGFTCLLAVTTACSPTGELDPAEAPKSVTLLRTVGGPDNAGVVYGFTLPDEGTVLADLTCRGTARAEVTLTVGDQVNTLAFDCDDPMGPRPIGLVDGSPVSPGDEAEVDVFLTGEPRDVDPAKGGDAYEPAGKDASWTLKMTLDRDDPLQAG